MAPMLTYRSLDGVTCAPDMPIRQVLERLNLPDSRYQVVVDPDGRPIGTITDGDVRRAMLRGVDLDGPAAHCMARPAVIGVEGDAVGNRRRMARLAMSAPFLPLVDGDGRLVRILIETQPRQRVRTALVMAGGFGKRLGDRTRTVPKPLLPIGGVPMLERILSSLEDAGVLQIYISVHYLADRIRSFVDDRRGSATITLIPEGRPLGTIGALGLLPADAGREPMFVMNGDVLTPLDLTAVALFHDQNAFDATIVVQRHVVDIPYGVVRTDGGGLFAGIEEKPRIVNYVAAGIYLLTGGLRDCLTTGETIDMPQLLDRCHGAGRRIGLFPLHEYWVDVGRPDDLARADADYEAGDGEG